MTNILNSYRKWKVASEIRRLLMADGELSDAVGSRIYPVVAPESTIGDFIVYKRVRYEKSEVKMGVYMDSASVSVSAVSDSYDRSVEIADAIDRVLCGAHRTSDNVTIRIELADAVEGYSDNKYFQTLIFQVK